MKLKVALIIICMSGLTFANAQNARSLPLVSAENRVSYSTLSITDPYLSPANYAGSGLQFRYSEQQFMPKATNNFSMQTIIAFAAGLAYNPTQTSSMTYLGSDISWGVWRHFHPAAHLQVLTGVNSELNVGVKSIARNVNNPANMDLALNLNIRAKARYDFRLWKLPMRFNYEVQLPVIGAMFVPMPGASYYEMFQLQNLSNTIHFSSLHNRLGFNQAFLVDLYFKKTVWFVGVGSNSLIYKANNIVFHTASLNFIVGYKYNFMLFKGRNAPIPPHYLNSDN
ncbi:MAG: hypothetical protein AUK44_07200 [Porphyromonadaceae bacterium CG2_30_38_12]|nr:MAG: hypothetical protein AUK44_07200 [Porphyromonadaceae bacterium CG2_30_38_12]